MLPTVSIHWEVWSTPVSEPFIADTDFERAMSFLESKKQVNGIPYELLARGEPVLIFPEGTRSRTGELQDFKAGLGLMAWELKAPIVPAYICGAYRALPAGRFLPRPHRLKVTFGSPISMAEYSAEDPETPQLGLYHQITEEVRSRIQEMAGKPGSS